MDEGASRRHSVLAVDDESDVREFLYSLITSLGQDCVTAVDGIDALEKLAQNEFDIVITDLSMPRMDGIELIKRVVADFPEVDLIAITGYHMKYNYTDIIALGASDFIAKPFSVDEVEAKIHRIARERSLRTELRRLSNRDGLTGLYNRRHFDENLRHEAIRAHRQHYCLYLLLLDVDQFKSYNDRYGHQQGDELMRQFAKIIRSCIRRGVDSAYRYGGDEFAVVLPHANRQQALLVAERLRTKYNANNLAPTSLSIGMAKLEGSPETSGDDIASLIKKADQALYAAKNKGGDQVCEEVETASGTGRSPKSPNLQLH